MAAAVGSASAGAALAARSAPLALCCASRVSASLAFCAACGSAAGADLDLVAWQDNLAVISLAGIYT
jgi:hypothetical protein